MTNNCLRVGERKLRWKITPKKLSMLKLCIALRKKHPGHRKLKILQVLEQKPPTWNGIGRFAVEIERHLPGIISCDIKTVDVTSIFGCAGDKKKAASFVIVNDYPVLSRGLFHMRKHVEWADIVIVHEIASLPLYASLWAKLTKKPVILWRHVHVAKLVEASIPGGWHVYPLLAFISNRVQRFFNRMASVVIFSGSNPDDKIGRQSYRFPMALDYSKFNPDGRGRIAKNKLGIVPDSFTVGYVGRLSKDKNLPQVYKTAARILDQFENSTFVCVGNGSLEPPANLLKNNRFTWIPVTDSVQEIMRSLDTIILLSETETGPLVIPEAMACGVVPVSVSLGICTSLIRDGMNGFLIRKGNCDDYPDSYLQCLERLYNSKRLREDMSRSAAADVKLFCPDWKQALDVLWCFLEKLTLLNSPNYKPDKV